MALRQPLDQEVRANAQDERAYLRLVERLSKASVEKHWEPYIDIAWDEPDMKIDLSDPRWEIAAVDSLSKHPWYREQPQEVRSGIGLYRFANAAKIGVQFENLLNRGLYTYAFKLPNGSAEFRYAYHEAIEEGHHGMMFQELVNRTGFDIPGIPPRLKRIAPMVVPLARFFPELFFFFVLGGEDPIDYVQRKMLAEDDNLHPLAERIMRIHVAEEARHLSFARSYLRRRIPEISFVRKRILRAAIPLILGQMSRLMLAPSRAMVKHFNIPSEVMDDAYRKNPRARTEVKASLKKVRDLAVELDLVDGFTKQIWKAYRIWDEPSEAAA
ncbi:MAG TPA: diiron oxygenase [Actinomycetota bacterium]|nr:diiron oxygenase [Actinomycetota bacterium]